MAVCANPCDTPTLYAMPPAIALSSTAASTKNQADRIREPFM
jgi:hypothetical protein